MLRRLARELRCRLLGCLARRLIVRCGRQVCRDCGTDWGVPPWP